MSLVSDAVSVTDKPTTTNATRSGRSHRHTPEEARREIFDAGIEFLWERPFRDLTVAELMARTTLSRPAFYQYFADLHALMEAMLTELESAVRQTASPWLGGQGEPIEAIRESLRGVIEVCIERGPILRAVAEAAPLDERLEMAWANFLDVFDDAVESRIKAQQRERIVDDTLNARRVAEALNRLDIAVLIDEFGHRHNGDPDAVLDTLHRFWVGVLYAGKPS